MHSVDEDQENHDWNLDGVGFHAFSEEKYGDIPIYQYHAKQSDGWIFHLSRNDQLGQGWTKDKIAFWAYPADQE